MNSPDSSLPAGHLIIAMIGELERQGIHSVYLRNYENLPAEVGNDVDLLVPPGKRDAAAKVCAKVARDHGWIFLGFGHFGPLAVYFTNLETTATLHLDLFDRIEWHCLEFADAVKILKRRRFNGIVHIPTTEDEIYLNLVTRLIYQGRIRDKHQNQAVNFSQQMGKDSLIPVFSDHLGPSGGLLARNLEKSRWQASPMLRNSMLRYAGFNYGLRRPWCLITGLTRYGLRIVRKLIHPPGHFIVLEGADGVGKSTILDAILPWISEWCAGRETYDFHWKPVRLRSDLRKQAPSVDPRATKPRSPTASFAYLMYHLTGFWWGWMLHIYPSLTKSHSVVGDRYSFDLFLDPARFRINLPACLCRIVSLLVPRPKVTVGLIADPNTIHARKPELTPLEISDYQERWKGLAHGRPEMVTVSADGPPEEVIRRVKQAILKAIANHGTQ